jgi:hypothetical protein
VDLNCSTFEIPYEQKTMEAIIKNLATNTTGIENTSKRYRTIINNVYKYINDIPYTDNDEMEISQYVREKLQKLADRKKYEESLVTIKSGIVSLKDSKLAVRSAGLLGAGKARINGLRLELKKRCGFVKEALQPKKYFVKPVTGEWNSFKNKYLQTSKKQR